MLKYILAIETSCDETSVCIIDLHGNIVVEETFSQISMHVRYGGVVPEIASRSHVLQIQIIVKNCLIAAKIDVQDIVAVAATIAPGLIGGLLVGTMFAKGMAQVLNIPFIGVNHLEGHIFSTKIADKECSFPLLILLVSGGHCQIIFAEKLSHYKVLGRTLDDAAGEAFDKTARMLGMPYPGGKYIEEAAINGNMHAFNLPISMAKEDHLNMSFSGLKTSVMHKIDALPKPLSLQDIADLSASVQYAISKNLEVKIEKAMLQTNELFMNNIKRFAVCGGVSANKYIRTQVERLCQKHSYKLHVPPLKYCTDNATMIAFCALEKYKNNIFTPMHIQPQSKQSPNEIFSTEQSYVSTNR